MRGEVRGNIPIDLLLSLTPPLFFFFLLLSQVHDGLAALARSPRLPIGDGTTTLELVKYEAGDKAAVATVQAAARIFKSAFGETKRRRERGEGERGGSAHPLSTFLTSLLLHSLTAPVLLEDGRDLVTLVTQRYVSPPEGEPLRAAAAAGPSASPPTDSEGEGEGGDDPDGPTHLDFDGFLVSLLRVGTAPVTAAVFR